MLFEDCGCPYYSFPIQANWTLIGESGQRYAAQVPGSVLTTPIQQKEIVHPFWRCEEKSQPLKQALMQDWTYTCAFLPPAELQGCQDEIWLCFDGIDTLAEIWLNDQKLGVADNMHRHWRFPVSKLLYLEENTLSLRFFSPMKYAQQRFDQGEIRYINTGTLPGSNYLRKAHYMFGWDWGPQLPDMGIWKDVYLQLQQPYTLDDVYLTQKHDLWEVTVEAKIQLTAQQPLPDGAFLALELVSPQGESFRSTQPAYLGENALSLRLRNPQLWWPNGLGDQPLYTASVSLLDGDYLLDRWKRRIGLRTLKVCREKDKWGESFAFEVNGVKFFAMGADYVPQDSFPHQVTPQRTRQLLQDCVDANFNAIRVWGGGYYPDNDFYDCCDELGLVVWQDCMFACNIYQLEENFVDTVAHEISQQILRLRHHPSLGLWCGNNEMEEAWVSWKEVTCHSRRLREDYRRLFEKILPEIFMTYDPQTLYWPSSPSTQGSFVDPNDPNRGDVHYWEVWHGGKPFEEYQKYFFRFCSEFGFQSFPCRKTMETFTLPQDRNIFSEVMENHQKNPSANAKILSYLAQYYRYPNSYDSLCYVSQLLQAQAMKFGVEHWRRNRGRCMGAIYWQLNDCWPVASWSSIDWYGRWKALHYVAKRFFAPFTASILRQGNQITVYLLNESREPRSGILRLFLRDRDFQTAFTSTMRVNAPAMSSTAVFQQDFSPELENHPEQFFFGFQLLEEGQEIAQDSCIFVPEKHLDLENPQLRWKVRQVEEGFFILVSAQKFARSVELSLEGLDGVFSDNYFDLCDDAVKKVFLPYTAITDRLGTLETGPVLRGVSPNAIGQNRLEQSLRLRSLYDSYDHS